ncbi:hypothetical protein ACTWQL_02670 [Pseudalkalibacillus sp. R45]|uniref:hypothetical protein n=1 Tax=Pseudalkalibacillus sp. R45 TaxID=3457433 RepID=UPI003FCDA778
MSQGDEWAHRTPRGKRASWSGNQRLSRATTFPKTAIKKKMIPTKCCGWDHLLLYNQSPFMTLK